jgi:hypothetical protein
VDVAEALSEPGDTGTPAQGAEIHEERTQTAPLPDSSGNFAIALIVVLMFALLVFILGLILYFRRKSRALAKPESNGSTPSDKESSEGSEPDLPNEPQITGIEFDNDEILNYIDRRIESALGTVEEFIGGTFRDATGKLAAEKRLSLRVKTPPGSVVVHWTDPEGVDRFADAINISMHSILFGTDLCEADFLDYIEMPRSGLRIGVARSIIKRRDAGNFIVNLVAFERETEDRKTWVELQTRMEEED